jgi:hypothetical protein
MITPPEEQALKCDNRLKSQSIYSRCRQAYRLDPLVIAMFAGVLLDTGTTWYFVSHHCGVEKNPTLAPLIRHSLIWIPIYLLCRPLMVPFIPDICRFAFSIYFGLQGLSFGLNNLSGILCGRYFLVDQVGSPAVHGVVLLFSIIIFVWRLSETANNEQDWQPQLLVGLRWLAIFMLLELAFFAVRRLAFHAL